MGTEMCEMGGQRLSGEPKVTASKFLDLDPRTAGTGASNFRLRGVVIGFNGLV